MAVCSGDMDDFHMMDACSSSNTSSNNGSRGEGDSGWRPGFGGSPHGSWHVDGMDMAWARIRQNGGEGDGQVGAGIGCCRCRVKDEWMEQAKARELEAYLVQERKARLELGGV